MAQKLLIIILIIPLCLVAGCWNQVNVNDTAVVSGIGVDLTDNKKIQLVTQINKPVNQQTSSEDSQYIVASATGDTLTEAARKVVLTLPRLPLWSHADTFIIGEKLAREDLSLILDFAFRNRNIRMANSVLISHNSSLDELYNSDCPLSLCSSRGIQKILLTQERLLGIYVPITLQEFIVKTISPGVDSFAPMVSVTKDLQDKDILTINGTAVFKGPKMAGILNVTESRGLFWLNAKQNNGAAMSVSFPQKPDIKVTIELYEIKTKIRPRIEDNQIFMDISVQANSNIEEIVGDFSQQNPKFVAEIENAAEKQIKSQIEACILKGQELNSDFLGFGRNIYGHYPEYWEKIQDNWYNYYPQVETNIDVKVSLILSELIKYNIYQK
ncbi:MAG: Ger(x)C family spore germination protein [Syntrophomonadaceae bacterium]|nr:Ger(x)C family spore germination protein [Syntrophomonadaceae bacterium]